MTTNTTTAERLMKEVQTEQYDLLVLGSGIAGKLIPWSLAKRGMKTAVIERKYVGGSCHTIACMPSKNVIHSAKVASYFWRSEEFGISKDNCRIDMMRVRERKRKMVRDLVERDLANFKASGAELIMGTGRSSALMARMSVLLYTGHLIRRLKFELCRHQRTVRFP